MCEFWYQDDKLHRDGAPAVTHYCTDGEANREVWFLNGVCVDPTDTSMQDESMEIAEYYRRMDIDIID